MLYILFFIFINTIVNAINCNVSQIHMFQGITPDSMTISWLTKDSCYSHVAYGNKSEVLEKYMDGKSISYNFTYILNESKLYQSGYIHNVLIYNLEPGMLYFYKCGDFVNKIKSPLLNFITLPNKIFLDIFSF